MPRNTVVLLLSLFLVISCQPQNMPIDHDRYIVTSPEVAEILAVLGVAENIVGITTECNYPTSFQNIEKIGNFGKVDFERVIELTPTIVFTSGLEQDALSAELKKLNIKVEKIYPQNMAEMLDSILKIGVIVGMADRAEYVVDSLHLELSKIKKQQSKTNHKIYVEIYGDPLMSVNEKSFVGELVTLAGGTNIFSDLPREYCRINAEKVIEADPEIIILAYPGVKSDDVMQRKGWEVISALQKKKVYSTTDIDPDLILRASPRCIEGIIQLQKVIYE